MRITLDTDDDTQVHGLVTALLRETHPPKNCPHGSTRDCQVSSMREALIGFGRTQAGLQGLNAQAIQEGRV